MKSPILFLTVLLAATSLAIPAERSVDPTFLQRHVPDVAAVSCGAGCSWKAVFGEGDAARSIVRSVARFGEFTLAPGGSSPEFLSATEEQVYVVMDGTGTVRYGDQTVALRTNDFLYLPPKVPHALSAGVSGCRVVVMGFRIPPGTAVTTPSKPLLANIDEVPKQVVGNHPPSTLYQLLVGDTKSKRDRIAAGHVLTSLFVMEFAADGTNFPHHHEREEEIYLVLNGHGDMVAGGGIDGIEGRHPAREGDAYFFRLNCTVGFYSANRPGEPKSRILALRSQFPF